MVGLAVFLYAVTSLQGLRMAQVRAVDEPPGPV